MKILILAGVAFVATTSAATAQITGLANKILSGTLQFGSLAPDPSFCGVIGGFTLICIICARRLRVKI